MFGRPVGTTSSSYGNAYRWERLQRGLMWMAVLVAVVGGGEEATEHRWSTMALCLAMAAGLYGLSWLVGWYSHR